MGIVNEPIEKNISNISQNILDSILEHIELSRELLRMGLEKQSQLDQYKPKSEEPLFEQFFDVSTLQEQLMALERHEAEVKIYSRKRYELFFEDEDYNALVNKEEDLSNSVRCSCEELIKLCNSVRRNLSYVVQHEKWGGDVGFMIHKDSVFVFPSRFLKYAKNLDIDLWVEPTKRQATIIGVSLLDCDEEFEKIYDWFMDSKKNFSYHICESLYAVI
jgi:hypothetical protein